MPSESYRILNFFDWSGGIRDRRTNPLAFPQNALMAGENVELADRGLKTRRGISLTSAGSLPKGEVMALAQVRFPSNETSFLVAQVRNSGIPFEVPASQSPPGTRILHYCCFDPENNLIWVFGGRTPTPWPGGVIYYNDLWYFDIDTATWHEITDATNHPTWYAHSNDMVYDPVYGRLILYVGHCYESDGTLINDGVHQDFWPTYDIGTNTWGEIAAGYPPYSQEGMSGWHEHGRLALVGRTIYILGGWNNEAFFPLREFGTFNVDTGNYGGIITTYDGDGPEDRASLAIAQNGTTSITVVGGHGIGEGYRDAWQLDLATNHWIRLEDLPLAEGDSFDEGALCYCSDKWWAIGSEGIVPKEDIFGNPQPQVLSDMAYVYVNGGWVQCAFSNEPDGRAYTRAYVSGTDIWLVLGTSTTIDEETGNIVLIEGAEKLSDICEWEPSSGSGALLPTSRLFASNDHLPTSAATFTEIYDLGEAERCTFAVLNDRVVITEGKAAPPLVWGGCMSTDASDWMSPKAVLVSQDGEHFYDVSTQVCDKDADSVADIGLISANGYLAVCTDMPLVEGFYFEMDTVNTVDTEEPGNQQTATVSMSSGDAVVVEDLKGLIANWVQDSGATGHFTDASNNPVTLGAGNDCPYVEPGLLVTMGANTATIVAITEDGEGSGEVELSGTYSNHTVDSVTGLTAESGALTVGAGFSPVLTAFTKSVPGTTVATGISGMSVRQILSSADLSQSGGYFRITISGGASTTIHYGQSSTTLYGTHHPVAQLAKNKAMISRISIGERDGGTGNTTETPTPITFPMRPGYKDTSLGPLWDYPSFVVTDDDGTFYQTINSPDIGRTFVSDWIQFEIDDSKDYLVIMDALDLRVGSSRGSALARISTGGGYYYLAGTGNVQETWNIADVSSMGFSEVSEFTYGVTKIEVKDRYPLPTQLLVGHTSDNATLDVSAIEVLRSVAVSQKSLGSTHVYHAVSLDGRKTFQVFKSDTWRTIVRYDSGWQYLNASDVWQTASVDTLIMALKEGLAITENQMSATELAAITSSQWMATGGFVVHETLSLDFAMGLLADTENVATVGSYTVTYNDAGETAIQGYSGNVWTGGEGFTDNTRLKDVPWGQSGTITYDGNGPFQAQHYVLNEVPGYWFRFKSNGTAEGTSITRVLYKAPCQPLANIGDGQPDIPLAMIFHDVSSDAKKDITIEVSGAQGAFTTAEDGTVTYIAGKATLPIQTTDYLYVGYLLQFNQIEITPYDGYENAVDSALSAEYWNGKEWTSIDITDETVGEDEDHPKTFSTKGKISWFLPGDWKMHIPLDADFPRGYYIRFSVSANLTSTTAIDEVRVYAVPGALAKHRFAVSFRDRIALVSRPDAPDQVDISRALEEYGFIGEDSGSYRVGGMDSIQCAVSAWNGLFLGKTETWHQLLGQTPEDFAFESVEAARHIPLNARVIVKAPMGGIDSGTKYGLFYINRFGAFVSTGLHTDTEWNTGKGALLSDAVNWWDEGALPRLALDSLHKACGEYWPVKNWVVWAVPMITEEGQTSQTTNNRLIIFDVALGAWLPPFTISLASLTAAYHHNQHAPGKLGEIGLYGGDYEGRIIRLFSSEDTTDLGEPISAWIETGWLHLGSPEWVKLIRRLQVYGQTTAGNNIFVKIWVDGNADPNSPTYTLCLEDLDEQGGTFFSKEEESFNAKGRFFKFRIEFQDVAQIFGIQLGMSLIREWGAF